MAQNGAEVQEVSGTVSRSEAAEHYSDGATSHGMPGTVLPRHVGDTGGSEGFDSQRPVAIVVDPDFAGQSKVLQPHEMGSIRTVDSDIPKTGYTTDENMRATAAAKLVAPTSASLTPQTSVENVISVVPAVKVLEPQPVAAPEVPEVHHILTVPEVPQSKITFELGPQIGRFDCYYHRIFRDGMFLILTWDVNFQGSRYTPPSGLQDAITVRVGKEREEFKVFLGPQYYDDAHSEDVLILIIEEAE